MCVLRILSSANRSALIVVCVILLLLTRNAAAITATTATGVAAATNYRNSGSYEDEAAAAAAAVVTAAMNAAALPAAPTTKDYPQQLPRYYQAPSAVIAARNVGGADVAAAPIYRSYYENRNVGSNKIGARTVITRDQMAQWRMPAGSERAAIASDEQVMMTAAGFVPTAMTAAGQHYVAGINGAVGGAPAGDDFPLNTGAEAVKNERGVSAGSESYAYETAAGKIDYEINADDCESGDSIGSDDSDASGRHTVTSGRATSLDADGVYESYKYDLGEYAEHVQHALAARAGATNARYEASTDVDSSNQGGETYFQKRLPIYENYFMPTYQIGQFSNYHKQQREQQEQQEKQERQEQQESEQQKLDEQRREQTQLRPLALFDSSDVDNNNAMLQQFNNGANIENYANDKQKLRYYAKQPQLQQQQQHQLQQQMRKQFVHEQQLQQQQQQLQLSNQPSKFPEFMHFSLAQHLPRPQQRPVRVPAKAPRPSDQARTSVRRRQQQQLQHQSRDSAALSSLQVIGNAARLSLLPALENLHADSDISSRGSISNKNDAATDGHIHSRSGNDKRSISEKVADITNAPSQFHYTLTRAHSNLHPAHVSELVDDSVNEIDDTHNNIDDNGNDSSSSKDTNRRGHQQDFMSVSHYQHQTAPYHQHGGVSLQQYQLPPITTTVRHTPASRAALAGIPLARHVEVTKHIPTVTDYERIHVPYNQSVPIRIPHPIVTAIPRPYAIRVPVAKNIVVPKVHEVRIPVEKVKPFPVERPVPFVVERRVPYMVEKQVAKPVYYPYPVQVPIVKTIVHKVPRRHHSYATYQPHQPSSYPLSMSQYHLQQQHSTAHTLPALHYTQTGHLG